MLLKLGLAPPELIIITNVQQFIQRLFIYMAEKDHLLEMFLQTEQRWSTFQMWWRLPPGSHVFPSRWGAPAGSGCPPWRLEAADCSAGSCARCLRASELYPSPAPPACTSGAHAGNGEGAQKHRQSLHADSWQRTEKKEAWWCLKKTNHY